jgi:hypothetical protein
MTDSRTTPEFQRGGDAALVAARRWHDAQASKTMILAGRSRFPKNLEREAEDHRRSAELIVTLSPDDVIPGTNSYGIGAWHRLRMRTDNAVAR